MGGLAAPMGVCVSEKDGAGSLVPDPLMQG